MANGHKNLIPIKKGELSTEQAKQRGRKGGIASGKARREKRTMKELLEIALSIEIKNSKGEKATMKEASAIQLATKAAKGDLKAIDLMSKLLGEQVQKTEITGADGNPIEHNINIDNLTSEQLEVLSTIGLQELDKTDK